MFKKIPRSVTIAGNSWDVRVTDIGKIVGDDEHNINGLTIHDPLSNTRQILLDSSIKNKKGLMRVFYHELFHAIVAESKLPNDALTELAEEVLAESFADFFCPHKKAKKKAARWRPVT